MHTNKMITIKTWLDSGANIHSCREVTFEIEEDVWNSMAETEQEEYAKSFAWDHMEWGYEVVGTDDNLWTRI